MKVKYYVDYEKAEGDGLEDYGDIEHFVPLPPLVHHANDAGIDLFAPSKTIVYPHSMLVVDTFVVFEMPVNSVGMIWPRGGDTHLVGSGVIDCGYRGTIKVRIINPFSTPLYFPEGASLGQLVILSKMGMDGLEVIESNGPISKNTERGDGGRINESH